MNRLLRPGVMMKSFWTIALLTAGIAAFTAVPASAAKAQTRCSTAGLRFVYAESDLDSDLSVSITFGEYTQRIRTLLKLYHRIPFSRETLACISNVEVPAEQALHHFVTAQTIWSTCVPRGGCDANHEAQLQRQWAKSSPAIQRATNNAT